MAKKCQRNGNTRDGPNQLNAGLKARAIRESVVEVSGSLYWRVAVTNSSGSRPTRRIRLGLQTLPSNMLKAENPVVEVAGLIQDLGHLPDVLPWDVPITQI